MLKMKNETVNSANNPTLIRITASVPKPKIGSTLPLTTPRVTFTTGVRGRAMRANPWAAVGREVKGKNVPHRKSMGVTKRNDG